jgi:hypothetical protein
MRKSLTTWMRRSSGFSKPEILLAGRFIPNRRLQKLPLPLGSLQHPPRLRWGEARSGVPAGVVIDARDGVVTQVVHRKKTKTQAENLATQVHGIQRVVNNPRCKTVATGCAKARNR